MIACLKAAETNVYMRERLKKCLSWEKRQNQDQRKPKIRFDKEYSQRSSSVFNLKK